MNEWGATGDRNVFVTETGNDGNLAAERHKQTFDHPEPDGKVKEFIADASDFSETNTRAVTGAGIRNAQ